MLTWHDFVMSWKGIKGEKGVGGHLVLTLVDHGLDREDVARGHDPVVLVVAVVHCSSSYTSAQHGFPEMHQTGLHAQMGEIC